MPVKSRVSSDEDNFLQGLKDGEEDWGYKAKPKGFVMNVLVKRVSPFHKCHGNDLRILNVIS